MPDVVRRWAAWRRRQKRAARNDPAKNKALSDRADLAGLLLSLIGQRHARMLLSGIQMHSQHGFWIPARSARE